MNQRIVLALCVTVGMGIDAHEAGGEGVYLG